MSPQDIDDLDRALREAARVLVPGGRLRMALVHPMNSAGRFTSREADAIFEISDSYFDERRYDDTIESNGLTMTFASIHRSLERVARAVFGAGLLIDYVAEPPDTSEPPGARWRRLPLFLHLGAVKPGA
jgi:SAM-dependent methyltransferase